MVNTRAKANLIAEELNEEIRAQATALQESESRWKFAIEGSGDGLWDWNVPQGTVFFTDRWKEMLGFAADEIGSGLDEWSKRIHPDDLVQAMADVQAHLEGRTPLYSNEHRVRCKDGSWKWFLDRGLVVARDTANKPLRVIGTYTDITERKQAEEALRESEERFSLAMEASRDGIWDWNLSTGTIYCSPALTAMLGFDSTDVIQDVNQWQELIHPKDRQKAYQANMDCVNGLTESFVIEYRMQAREGGWTWILGRGRTVHRDASGRALRMIGTHQDITERKQAEEKLQLAASVFSTAREGIMITDPDGSLIDVNEAFTSITGFGHDEVIGKHPRILSSGRHGPEFYAAMWHDLKERGHWNGEIWNRRKNGEVYPVLQTITTVHDPEGNVRHYVALFSDITSIKKHQNQLERSAHYDALTSLPNRVLLADRQQHAMAQARRRGRLMAVAFLDLDGFKAINDKHGHEAGDALLIALSTRMTNSLRESDTLARIGGDEFVAVLADLSGVEESEPMLSRLLAAIAEPVPIGAFTVQVSASLGVTFYPQAEDIEADQLQRQADQAMYQAKLAGKNCYHVFDTVHDRSVRGQHESIEDIRRALMEREFVLYYHPKVNMRSGAVVGAEALIRWQHPQLGLLAPASFLPVMEGHPLASEIGEWVIESALTQKEIWRAAGLDIPISVNVGGRQLQQPDFVQRLQAVLKAHPAFRPGDLEMEVLETSALEDIARVSKVIEACRALGVAFALDDFGTGYSSLTYLKRLPVSMLKIDQSFVRDMLDDPEDLAILEGVLRLASAFLRVPIAEGVETMEHGKMLLQLGCDLAQGYVIARPMPADQMPAWAATWSAPSAWANCPQIKHEHRPLLHAAVEHRAWIVAVEGFLKGERARSPQLDPHQCRFGLWLDAERRAGRDTQPSFSAIDTLHLQTHALADELGQLRTEGRATEAVARLGELHSLCNALLGQMKVLGTSG
ncbi:EAL domain-containing protein [Lamprobacter modestohalophilus]|uniref:EAL domain-containing protein n=1 Tax=Lamprobacter modestohalophilus TaxID=1064514 RepID=UPI002ADEDEF8|nr:EAL domain-containing protein [Lamprobacter modestohalophilus]MEA1052038.1 EAL domain-containing protein [Lamprobacter modestohalophilus]